MTVISHDFKSSSRDLARDSGQLQLTSSKTNPCASSRSVYLSGRLDPHWDKKLSFEQQASLLLSLPQRELIIQLVSNKNFPLHAEGSVIIMKNNIVKVLECCLQDRSGSVLEMLFSW